MSEKPSNTEDPLLDAKRYAREARRLHGADAWLMELLAPLRNVRVGRVSVGEMASVATFCLRHLREDRASQIAAALAFRTLLGLVPVLVVVTLVAKTVLGSDDFVNAMSELFAAVGLQNVKPQDASDTSVVSLHGWLIDLVKSVSNLNLSALGWTGFVLVALSAIWVLATIEEAFNLIYRCVQGRSWVRRILVYWFVLTVAPLLLGAMLLLARLNPVERTLPNWTWLVDIARIAGSLFMFWLCLLVGYMTIPATRVSWRPSMIGAFVGAILLQIGKSSFNLYVSKSFAVSALYGSLGLIPFFMFWVYLMWLVTLFGAEVAALLQAFRGRSRKHSGPTEPDAEASLRALGVVVQKFEAGATTTLLEIAEAARLPLMTVIHLVDRLEDGGFVRRIGETEEVSLARPADAIRVSQVLEHAWATLDRRGPASPLEVKLRDAQRAVVGSSSMRDPG